MLPSFLQTKKGVLALSFSVHGKSSGNSGAQSPVLRLTLDWMVVVYCHVCWACDHATIPVLVSSLLKPHRKLHSILPVVFLLIVFADSFIRVYNVFPLLSLSTHVISLPVISFPHACLFVLWLSDFSQGHLCDYSFALPTGVWWAHPLVHNWRQCLSLPQNPLVDNSSAGRGGAHEPLPDPWLTEQEILK